METYNIHEAKTHFSKLISRVEAGEEIIIGRNGKQIAKLMPCFESKTPRKLGLWEGRKDVWVADDAFAPDQEIIDMFDGKYSQ